MFPDKLFVSLSPDPGPRVPRNDDLTFACELLICHK